VFLCGDTLVANGTITYRCKIIPTRFLDGHALLGYSGNDPFGQQVTEEIKSSLERWRGTARTHAEIAEHIRKKWFENFKKHHSGNDLAYDQLIAAVWSRKESSAQLYASVNASFAKSADNFEAIGIGDTICRYISGRYVGGPSVLPDVAFNRVVAAIGLVKRYIPHQVGGNLTAFNLTHAGRIKIFDQCKIEQVEGFAGYLDEIMRVLSDRIATALARDIDIEKTLSEFCESVRDVRGKWNEDTLAAIAAPPREVTAVSAAFRDLLDE